MTNDPHWRPHAAFVLAAGLGKRMRHLTHDIPKPMVPLNGIPLIDRVLDRIAAEGIARAVVNVHYMADALEAHLAARTAPAITISNERGLLLETGGGVIKAWPHLGTSPFLIHNSDSVWIERATQNLASLSAAWNPDTMDSLMLLAPLADSLGYDGDGDFDLAPSGQLSRRKPGTKAPYVFAGVSIAHPRMFDGAPSGAFSLNKVWDKSIAQGRVYGVRLDGIWMHVGTPEAVTEAERRMDHEHAR
ncbi:MAG: nucleotidyltransferase family protein [Hyphomicrobiaceae bacterium]